jgi:hypothetical protein
MKNKHEKKELLQELSEDSLRQEVLIPLLSKMGFIDPIHHHHQNEKGKDIVCKEYDQVFKKTKYIAVVVKKGNITGSSSSSDGYFNVINQIKQVFNEPYKHVYELREIYIDQCILVASGKFLATSLESIYGTLKQERLDKVIRDAIDVDKLICLIDDNFHEYWDERETEKEFLVKQRNTLMNNVAKIIKLIIPDSKDQTKALRIISNTDTDLELFKLSPLNKFSAHLSYKKLSIDEIDEYYTDDIVNPFADIKETVYSIKKEAQSILSNFDEVAFILEDILRAEDPLKVIEYCTDLRSYVNGYHRLDVGGETYLHQQDDFYYGLMNYRDKKEFLIKHNLLEVFRYLKSSAKEIITKALIVFLKKYPSDTKSKWLGCKVIIPIDISATSIIQIYEFDKDDSSESLEGSKIVKNNGIDEIIIEMAINKYGIYKKEQLNYEAQAQSLLWHFTDTIENQFFILKGYEEVDSD